MRRETIHDEIMLGVLDAVEADPAVSQRGMAKQLGIALGLANSYVKHCAKKGLIKVQQAPARRYAYYLTPHGLTEKSRLTASYLAHSFAFFRRARAQFGEVFTIAAGLGQNRLALLGDGDLTEIARLVSLEKGVKVVGTVTLSDLVTLQRDLCALGEIDAIVVTTLDDPREAYRCAIELFGKDRVHVPELLRVHARRSVEGAP